MEKSFQLAPCSTLQGRVLTIVLQTGNTVLSRRNPSRKPSRNQDAPRQKGFAFSLFLYFSKNCRLIKVYALLARGKSPGFQADQVARTQVGLWLTFLHPFPSGSAQPFPVAPKLPVTPTSQGSNPFLQDPGFPELQEGQASSRGLEVDSKIKIGHFIWPGH